VDEAQNLTFPVLEEIRLLTNLETSTDKLLQIVLSGQPELEEKLKLPQLRQLRQRITLRCKTLPMTKEQTHEYIQERLRVAGGDPQAAIFPLKTIEMIHYFSMGIPRVINLLCEHALINSFVEQQKVVEPRVIEEVAREFQLDELEPLAPPPSPRPETEVFQSEQFIQNLGEALSRFRMSPSVSSSTRERK
jgi:type II secretory pathway predicted ATPase ExeA